MAELSETATLLRQELHTQQEESRQAQRLVERQLDECQSKLQEQESQVAALQAQLAQAPHPDEIARMRKELAILKRLEFNQEHDDDEDDPSRDPYGGFGGRKDDSDNLEAVLVAKLRKAENDLVEERVRRTNLVTELDEAQAQVQSSLEAQRKSEALVASLEADLERATTSTSSSSITTTSHVDKT